MVVIPSFCCTWILTKIRLKETKGDTNCVLLLSEESGISYPAPICMKK
jgi:hypothetical protein